MGYKAYYEKRSDGDGDLFAVIEDGSATTVEGRRAIEAKIVKALTNEGGYFVQESGECDFPDVWDMHTGLSAFNDHVLSQLGKLVDYMTNALGEPKAWSESGKPDNSINTALVDVKIALAQLNGLSEYEERHKDEPHVIYTHEDVMGDEDNPQCMCSVCGFEGRLMDDFSLLLNGFNGIEAGSEDDVDLQECGNCEARLQWK
jgi:hypothetical protein